MKNLILISTAQSTIRDYVEWHSYEVFCKNINRYYPAYSFLSRLTVDTIPDKIAIKVLKDCKFLHKRMHMPEHIRNAFRTGHIIESRKIVPCGCALSLIIKYMLANMTVNSREFIENINNYIPKGAWNYLTSQCSWPSDVRMRLKQMPIIFPNFYDSDYIDRFKPVTIYG